MLIELKEASLSDGRDIFEMIMEIGPGENEFVNNGFDLALCPANQLLVID